jgi:hypothetical protein
LMDKPIFFVLLIEFRLVLLIGCDGQSGVIFARQIFSGCLIEL